MFIDIIQSIVGASCIYAEIWTVNQEATTSPYRPAIKTQIRRSAARLGQSNSQTNSIKRQCYIEV